LDRLLALAREAGREGGIEPNGTAAALSREPWLPTSLVPLPRMLHLLWRERRTGLLTHRVGERRTLFALDEGRLRFVRTNDPVLGLDRVLRQLGVVREDELRTAQRELDGATTRMRLGEVLVRQGALTRGQLDCAIQVQLRKMI